MYTLWQHHVKYTVVILKESNLPHPRCPLCDMMMTWKALNGTHRRTTQCTQGVESKRRKLATEEEMGVTARDFSAYGRPLNMVTSSK